MSYSKIKKVRISKYDKVWSKAVRDRDKRCLVCGKTEYLAAHHFIRRGVKSTRLALDNGITLCPSHHTFSSDFSAHRTPESFKRWFEETYSDRAKAMRKREQTMMSEREAIKEFEALYG
jgi:5-methylcytosine-specific restriction endonuclease McrA